MSALETLNNHIKLCTRRLEQEDRALLATAAGDNDQADQCDREIEQITIQIKALNEEMDNEQKESGSLSSYYIKLPGVKENPYFPERWDRFSEIYNKIAMCFDAAGLPVADLVNLVEAVQDIERMPTVIRLSDYRWLEEIAAGGAKNA